jgi:serine/threonine protein kinase
MTVGTAAYAAPEQLLGEDLDGRADQYALAATAYHLLTGSHLFPQSNPAVVIGKHLNATPPTLTTSRPELGGLDPALAATRPAITAPASRPPLSEADTSLAASHRPAPHSARRRWLVPGPVAAAVLLSSWWTTKRLRGIGHVVLSGRRRELMM